jgi:hypothetical protein
MTVMYKATVEWSGFPGAPGYTNLYAFAPSDLQAGLAPFLAGIQTLFGVVKNGLAASTGVQARQTVETIEDSTGELLDVLSAATAPAGLAGALGGGITGPTGACIDWTTAGAVFGRRRMGRTFIVPVAAASIDATGTLDNSYRTSLTSAANAYASSGAFNACVWVRRKAVKPPTTPPTYVHNGQAVRMTGARVPDMAAVLRSRRD